VQRKGKVDGFDDQDAGAEEKERNGLRFH